MVPTPRKGRVKTDVLKHLATVALVLAACAHPAPTSVRPPVPVNPPAPLRSPAPSNRAAAPRSDADRDKDFATAWATWNTGKHADATTAFGKLFRELRALATNAKPFPFVSGATGRLTLAASDDGTHQLAQSREGVYWFDTTGAVLRYDALEAHSVAFIPGTSLAALWDPDLTIIDAATFAPVFTSPNVLEAKASPSGKLLVYVEWDGTKAGKVTFHVWDVATKHDARTFDLRPGESWQLFSLGFSPDEKELFFELSGAETEDALGNITDAGDYHEVLIDEAGHRVDFPARLGNTRPSFSSDGKYVAYGYSTYTEGKGSAGKTILIDRATRKQFVTSAVDYPTATEFSNNSKYLIVGALLELHVLAVPSLRVIATTPELRARSRYGGDDMQDTGGIDIIGADKAFSASTADGTTAVFRLPSAKLVWKGPEGTPAERIETKSGAAFAIEGALVTVDDKLQVSHRPLTHAELAGATPDPLETLSRTLEGTVCTVGDRLFPIAACH